MWKKLKVGVLMGGVSSEREVSLKTGEAIYEALKSKGYNAVKIYVEKNIADIFKKIKIDVAFIALHGKYGEDGCIQGLLELYNIPYTGSGVLASALAMNKIKSKELFRLYNIPTPPYYVINKGQENHLIDIHASFGFPVVIKPANEGSSVGVSLANNFQDFETALREAFEYDDQVVVERYVKGKEIAIAVLDGNPLGAIEIVPKNQFYDYQAKYQKGMSEYHFPARLNPTRYQGVLNLAAKAHLALGCSGASRVDLLATEGDNEYVLEVNTLPGMTPTSLLPKIAGAKGLSFPDLCEKILQGARLHNIPLSEQKFNIRQEEEDLEIKKNSFLDNAQIYIE